MTSSPGSWDEDRERKYVAGAEVSADERIAWLEEMIALAYASGALPKPRDAWGQPLPPGIPTDAPTRQDAPDAAHNGACHPEHDGVRGDTRAP